MNSSGSTPITCITTLVKGSPYEVGEWTLVPDIPAGVQESTVVSFLCSNKAVFLKV